LKRTFREH